MLQLSQMITFKKKKKILQRWDLYSELKKLNNLMHPHAIDVYIANRWKQSNYTFSLCSSVGQLAHQSPAVMEVWHRSHLFELHT